MNQKSTLVSIVGARPQFIKVKPVIEELKKKKIKHILVHTGQHYDYEMSKIFFDELNIPEPDYNLEIGPHIHGKQTALMLERIEKVLLEERPRLVIVYGDTNSTLAAALAAVKLNIPIAHIESGLRSFDREMPEEINRIVTDVLCDYLFTTCKEANHNLEKEGIPKEKIFFVGNVMVDTLRIMQQKIESFTTYKDFGLTKKNYALLTLHRPENVDDKQTFGEILVALEKIQEKIKIIFPVHPRTTKQIETFGFQRHFLSPNEKNIEDRRPNLKHQLYNKRILWIDPLGYLKFLNLIMNCKFVLTDSGGMQEETTVLGIPCLTLRKNTERPITVTSGTNTIVGTNKKKIVNNALSILDGSTKDSSIPELWDGKTAQRIVMALIEKFTGW